MKILIVGSNPSQKAANNEAFTSDTASGRLVRKWIEGIPGHFYFDNICREKTENNRPLSAQQKQAAVSALEDRICKLEPDRIIALGRTAAGVLKFNNIDCLEMPHPSGCNRLLNDKEYTEKKLQDLREWCKPRAEDLYDYWSNVDYLLDNLKIVKQDTLSAVEEALWDRTCEDEE